MTTTAGGLLPALSPDATVPALRGDRAVLLHLTAGRTDAELAAPYAVADGPLGHFCESLHDLAAHILMWDEISLAVLVAAGRGRAHWSLDPRWETAAAGTALNRGGVDAGRRLPSGLVVHRLHAAVDDLVAEVARHDEDTWSRPRRQLPGGRSLGALLEYASTPPDGSAPYAHVAKHLAGSAG